MVPNSKTSFADALIIAKAQPEQTANAKQDRARGSRHLELVENSHEADSNEQATHAAALNSVGIMPVSQEQQPAPERHTVFTTGVNQRADSAVETGVFDPAMGSNDRKLTFPSGSTTEQPRMQKISVQSGLNIEPVRQAQPALRGDSGETQPSTLEATVGKTDTELSGTIRSSSMVSTPETPHAPDETTKSSPGQCIEFGAQPLETPAQAQSSSPDEEQPQPAPTYADSVAGMDALEVPELTSRISPQLQSASELAEVKVLVRDAVAGKGDSPAESKTAHSGSENLLPKDRTDAIPKVTSKDNASQNARDAHDAFRFQSSTGEQHSGRSNAPLAPGFSTASSQGPQPGLHNQTYGDARRAPSTEGESREATHILAAPDLDDAKAVHSAIDTAGLIRNMNESGMRVAMRSADFGNISITALDHKHTVSAQISLEHAELANEITAGLPQVRTSLGDARVDIRVVVSDDMAAHSGSGTSHSGDQHQHERPQAAMHLDLVEENTPGESAVYMLQRRTDAATGLLRLDVKI